MRSHRLFVPYLIVLLVFALSPSAFGAADPVPWPVEAARLRRGLPVAPDRWEDPPVPTMTHAKATGDALHAVLLGAFPEGPVATVAVSGARAFVGSGGRLQAVDVTNASTPSHLGFLTLPEPARDIAMAGSLVLVADGDSGLRIVDAADPGAMVELGRLVLCGPAEGVATVGTTAYVGAGACGLRIVDFGDPTAPEEIGFLDTPGYARGIALGAGQVYVADGSGGLRIVDVATPTAPIARGDVAAPGDVLRVAVTGSEAYLACGQDGFHTADVGDPDLPVIVGHLNDVSAADVAVAASSVLVADSYLGMITVDVSILSAPAWVGMHLAAGLVDAVAAVGNVAFLADDREGLRLVDCAVPASPSPLGLMPAGGVAGAVLQRDETAYLAAGYAGVRILDVTDPMSPADLGTADCDGNYASGLALEGGLLLVAARTGGLRMFDVTDPAAVTPSGTFATGGYGYKVAAHGTVAFLADGGSGLHVIDITDPAAAFTLADMNMLGTVRDVRTDSTDVCAVTTEEFLVLDASDPANTAVVGRLPVAGSARSLAIRNGLAYVGTWSNGLRIIDFTTPSAPVEVGAFTGTDWLQDVEVFGGLAYLADYESGVRMVDVRDPSQPLERGYFDTGGTAYGVYASVVPVGVPDLAGPDPTDLWYTPPVQVWVADGFNGLQIIESWAAVVAVPEAAAPFAAFNYPNPFNPRTVIAFDLPTQAEVDLKIYDVAGRLVRTALSGVRMGEGRRSWTWNGNDEAGRALASGVYLYEVRAAGRAASGTMTLVR